MLRRVRDHVRQRLGKAITPSVPPFLLSPICLLRCETSRAWSTALFCVSSAVATSPLSFCLFLGPFCLLSCFSIHVCCCGLNNCSIRFASLCNFSIARPFFEQKLLVFGDCVFRESVCLEERLTRQREGRGQAHKNKGYVRQRGGSTGVRGDTSAGRKTESKDARI